MNYRGRLRNSVGIGQSIGHFVYRHITSIYVCIYIYTRIQIIQ